MAFTPRLFRKDNRTETADSYAEETNLLFDGWLVDGSTPPAADPHRHVEVGEIATLPELKAAFGSWSAGLGDASQPLDVTALVGTGGSMMEGWGAPAPTQGLGYFGRFAAMFTGRTRSNIGHAGEPSQTANIRNGATVLRLRPASRMMPAAGGAATMQAQLDVEWPIDQDVSIRGALGTATGTLTRAYTSGALTFTRDAGSGAALAQNGYLPFIADESAHLDGLAVLDFNAQNEMKSGQSTALGTVQQRVRAQLSAAVAARPTGGELILGAVTSSSQGAGSWQATAVQAINAERASLYGDRFIDQQAWLIANGLARLGITPTTADTAAIAAGTIPPSLTADGLHYSPEAHRLVSYLIRDRAIAKGWGAGVLPFDDFDRADGALGSTSIGAKPWEVTGGWAIAGGKLSAAGLAGTSAALIDTGRADLTVEVTLSAISGAVGGMQGGIILRATDAGNFIYLAMRQSGTVAGLGFFLMQGGAVSPIGDAGATTSTAVPTAGSRVRVTCSGSTLTAYLNGVQACSWTSTFNQAATRVGIYGGASGTALRWDDFETRD